MNLSKTIFCQIDEADLKRDSTVAIFATVADYRVKQPSCTKSAMKARAQNHFVGLHEMVTSVQPRGIEMTHSKDHTEELLGMVYSRVSGVYEA